jgi:hypothetical protein
VLRLPHHAPRVGSGPQAPWQVVRYPWHAQEASVFKNEWKGWLLIVLAPTLLGLLAVGVVFAVWALGQR